MSDRDGYPTDEELQRIRDWSADDPSGWFAAIRASGNYWPEPSVWGWDEADGVYHVSTGGWSGNEEILQAMEENLALWGATYHGERRGGHFVFALPGVKIALEERNGD